MVQPRRCNRGAQPGPDARGILMGEKMVLRKKTAFVVTLVTSNTNLIRSNSSEMGTVLNIHPRPYLVLGKEWYL